jgi:hypothetical protein
MEGEMGVLKLLAELGVGWARAIGGEPGLFIGRRWWCQRCEISPHCWGYFAHAPSCPLAKAVRHNASLPTRATTGLWPYPWWYNHCEPTAAC